MRPELQGEAVARNQEEALSSDYAEAKRRAVSMRKLNVALGHEAHSSWGYQVIEGQMPGFSIDRVPVWVELTGGRHLVRYFASLAGLDCVERQCGAESGLGVAQAGERVNRAIAEAFASIEDGQVTVSERDVVSEAIDRARADLLDLLRLRRAIHAAVGLGRFSEEDVVR